LKEIKLLFYRTIPSPENIGLKQVLFEITDRGQIVHDFGYCNWNGVEWELPEVPKDFEISVHSWANNPDPKHLVYEAKILRL